MEGTPRVFAGDLGTAELSESPWQWFYEGIMD